MSLDWKYRREVDDKKDRLRDIKIVLRIVAMRGERRLYPRRRLRGTQSHHPLNWVEVKPSWKSCNPQVLRYLGSEDGLNTRTSLQILASW